MRNIAKLIATTFLTAGLISAGPAHALTLNLGGGPGGLIQTGDGGGININTNPGGGGSGGGSGGFGVNVPGTNTGGNIDLFGSTTGVSGGALGGNGNHANVSLGLGGLFDDLFGPGGNGQNGGNGRDGSDGGGGQGGGVRIASLEPGDGACFIPTRAQLDKLMNRHSYAGNLIGPAASIQIVKVPMCDRAQSKLAAAIASNANVQVLRDKIDASGRLTSKLSNAGYSSEDVIAVDRQGGKLIVYVL